MMTWGERLHYFANPYRFHRLSVIVLPWSAAITALLFGAGLYLALFVAPADYQQGESARIMYVHVPAAWMALFTDTVMAASSAVVLVWKHPLADVAARASAPVGAAFTFLALFTGSLWGVPMWGTWWVWDARLTSVLVLLFLYLGYIVLQGAFDDPQRGAKVAAIFSLVGFVNVPIIKYSVDWWNTLHQPASVLKASGPAIDASMLWPLLIMALAYKGYYLTVLLLRMRGELADRKIQAALRSRAHSPMMPATGAVSRRPAVS